jgi:GR25 family glycosyltransferase involved in LPS biosynthesis
MLRGAPTFYWINLDRATYRSDRLTAEFNRHGVQNVRVRAVDGKKMQFTHTRNSTTCELGTFHDGDENANLTRSCTLSHLKAVRMFWESGADTAIICEDDLTFEYLPKWKRSLHDVISSAPADWHVIQLGVILDGTGDASGGSKASRDNYDLLASKDEYLPRRIHCRMKSTVAYAINHSGAEKLLEAHGMDKDGRFNIRTRFFQADFDGVYHPSINTYTYHRPLFTYPMENDSFIHQNHVSIHDISKIHIDSIHDDVMSPPMSIVAFETTKYLLWEIFTPAFAVVVLISIVSRYFPMLNVHDFVKDFITDLEVL